MRSEGMIAIFPVVRCPRSRAARRASRPSVEPSIEILVEKPRENPAILDRFGGEMPRRHLGLHLRLVEPRVEELLLIPELLESLRVPAVVLRCLAPAFFGFRRAFQDIPPLGCEVA